LRRLILEPSYRCCGVLGGACAHRSDPGLVGHYIQLETKNKSPWPKNAAVAQPNTSQFHAILGCRTEATPASTMAASGARSTLPSAKSMIGPMAGRSLISSDEKRIDRKANQIIAQRARQDIDAFRSDDLFIASDEAGAGSLWEECSYLVDAR